MVGPGAAVALDSVARTRGARVTAVGGLLTVDDPGGWQDPEKALRESVVLTDLEVVFSPQILIDPLRLLTRLARRRPLVAFWPGDIQGGRAGYSQRGRPDYYSELVPSSAVIVRARVTAFPDEVPFELERS